VVCGSIVEIESRRILKYPGNYSRYLDPPPRLSVSARQSRAAWARLIKKVYDTDP